MPDPLRIQMKTWDSYTARKKLLDERAVAISERYSQWLITIAGGALGLSLTFLEKMAPNPAAETLWLAIVSWSFLVLRMLGAFLAIYFSQEAIRRQLEIVEYKQKVYNKLQDPTLPDVPADDCRNKYSEGIRTLDKWSVAALMLGIAALCLFSFLNLKNEKRESSGVDPESMELSIDLGEKKQKVNVISGKAKTDIDLGEKKQNVRVSIGKVKTVMSDDKESQTQQENEGSGESRSYIPTQEDQAPPSEGGETSGQGKEQD